MNPLRVVLLVAAVGAAGYLAFRGLSREAPKPSPPQAPPTEEPAAGGAFPTFDEGKANTTPPAPDAPPKPAAAAAVEPEREPAPGTPATRGAQVAVVVPYRAGTKTRYRVMDANLARDLETGLAQAQRFLWEVATEVTQGDGTGAARVRFSVESFVYNTDAMGRPIAFDSKRPDEKLLADPQLGLGRMLRPLVATCGVPVEFVIETTGAVRAVEGVDALRRAYLDVVDSFGAEAVREAIDAPDGETLREKWGEILFPALGGGAIEAGTKRDATLRTTLYERWALVVKGSIQPTHDDPDRFRAEFRGTPSIEEINRPARSAFGRAIEKMRVDASADSFRAAWQVDRAQGRVAWSRIEAKYRAVISRRGAAGGYEARWTNVERLTTAEVLGK